MIDRSLNYGRKHISNFAKLALSQQVSPVILDIGAGKGDDLLLVKQLVPQARLHAIECYHRNIEVLQKNNISAYKIDIEKEVLPFNSETIDLIISNQTLEHTKEVFWICHEVTRVLKIGGHFLLGLPNLASFHNRLLLASGKQPSSIKTASAHVRGFTKPDVLNFFNSCFLNGYLLIEFAGSNFYPFPPIIEQPLAALWPTGAWGIFFLFRKQIPYDEKSFIDFPSKAHLETNFFTGIK